MLKNSDVVERGGESRSSWLQSPSLGMRLRLIHQVLPGMGLNDLRALISERDACHCSQQLLEGKVESSLIAVPLQVLCSCLTADCTLSWVPVPVTARLCVMRPPFTFISAPRPPPWLLSPRANKVFSTWAATNSISPEHPFIINNPISRGRTSTCQVFSFFFMSDRLSLSSTKVQCIVERHWKKNRFLFPFF